MRSRLAPLARWAWFASARYTVSRDRTVTRRSYGRTTLISTRKPYVPVVENYRFLFKKDSNLSCCFSVFCDNLPEFNVADLIAPIGFSETFVEFGMETGEFDRLHRLEYRGIWFVCRVGGDSVVSISLGVAWWWR